MYDHIQLEETVYQSGGLRKYAARGVQGLCDTLWQRWGQQYGTVTLSMLLQ